MGNKRFKDCGCNRLFLKQLTLKDADRIFPEAAMEECDELETLELDTFALLLSLAHFPGYISNDISAEPKRNDSDSQLMNSKGRVKEASAVGWVCEVDSDYAQSSSDSDEPVKSAVIRWHDCDRDGEARMWIEEEVYMWSKLSGSGLPKEFRQPDEERQAELAGA